MNISPQTTTHVYLQGKECLHILAEADALRVRWMRDGVWVLRWNAIINDEGEYIDQRIDGELVECLNGGKVEDAYSAFFLQSMHEASTRLPLYPNPDIVRELEWFAMDDPVPLVGIRRP